MDFKLESRLRLPDQIFDVRYHPNSQTDLLAAVTIGGNVHLIESGQLKDKLKKHHKGSSIRKVRFTHDGRLITIARTVKVHDLLANKTLHTLKRNDEARTQFYSVHPFGANLVSAGDDDGGIFVYDTRTPEKPVFTAHDCEQYISDIDGRFDARRMMVCTSGEGTLTAYDLRANKMLEPQSELFDAGFQCVKLLEANKKVVIGGEDGAVYVFNQNEWAHTSGKFAISSDLSNRGKCSIDCLDILPDNSTFVVGCSDGRMRSLTLWPHQVLGEAVVCRKSALESLHVNPNADKSQLVVCGENYIDFLKFEEKVEKEDDEDDDEDSGEDEESNDASKTTPTSSAATTEGSDESDAGESPPTDPKQKKLKLDLDEHLDIFK